MSRDTFTDRSRMTHAGLSMTAEQWRDYFKWEDRMKAIHGERFHTCEACFLRDPFRNRKGEL